MKQSFGFEILNRSNFTGAGRFFSQLKAVSLRLSFIEGFFFAW